MAIDKTQDDAQALAEAVVGEGELEAAVVRKVPVGKLGPSPFQPRLEFGAADLAQLAESVKQAGVLEPLLVRATEGGRYEIIAGERRWRAAQAAGMKSVPCLVLEVDDTQARLIGLIENLHRRDLSDYERGRALKQIKDALGVSWDKVAERVGLRRQSVHRLVSFAELPPELEEAMGGGTSMRHYEALALLSRKPKQQAELAQAIRQRELKGPEAKRAAQAVKEGKAKSIEDALRQGSTKPEKKKAEPQAKGDRVAQMLGEMVTVSMRLRGISGGGLTASQRVRIIGGMEALRDDMTWLIDLLRREEK